MKSPIVLLQSLLDDLRRLDDAKGTERDLITLSQRFEAEGYGFLAVALPTLCKSLERGLAEGWFTCPTGFKRVRGGAIPRLFSGMLCEIFDPITGKLKDEAQPCFLKDLLQVLRFFKKLPTDALRTERLERESKVAFVSVDGQVIMHFNDGKLDFLKRVVRQTLTSLHSFRSDEIVPKHGPGSVYDGETANQKWMTVCNIINQDDADTREYGLADILQVTDDLDFQTGSYVSRYMQDSRSRVSRRHASRGSARLVMVPKYYSTLRAISVEPCWNQFIQQGLNRVLRESISKCKVLSNCLALTDQTRNQELAKIGSRTGSWSTLDLKSASDLLSKELVYHIFDHFPKFRECMEKCRTPDIEIDGRRLALRKYAGMGNATTFPVQSIVFASIAIAAVCNARGLRPSRRNVIASSRLVRVFGDDIIIDSRYAHHVVAWLEDFGLIVNTDKSFLTGNFKESCGYDGFKGVNVTPIYLRAMPCDSSIEPKAVLSLISTANQAWFAGLYATAQTLSDEVERRLGRRLPLVRTECGGLGWHTRQNAYQPTTWLKRLQGFGISTLVVKGRKVPDQVDGLPALLKFFMTPSESWNNEGSIRMLNERPVDHLKKSSRRYTAYIARKMVAA